MSTGQNIDDTLKEFPPLASLSPGRFSDLCPGPAPTARGQGAGPARCCPHRRRLGVEDTPIVNQLHSALRHCVSARRNSLRLYLSPGRGSKKRDQPPAAGKQLKLFHASFKRLLGAV